MVKSYNDWLFERDLATPITVEIEAGRIKVFADPQAENWMGETVRSEIYEQLLDKMQKALKEEDDDLLRNLLRDARDLALFSQDTSNVWKMSQVDGIEKFRTGAEYRRWLAKYCIRKIELFLDWSRNNI